MKKSLNLMSAQACKHEQIRCCLRLWTRLLATVLVCLVLCGAVLGHSHHTEQSKLELVEAKYKPVRLLIQENTQLRDEIDLLQKQERIPLTLAKHQPLLGLIGLATQAVSEHGDSVYLQQIEIERDPLAESAADGPTLTFLLSGISLDSTAPKQLVNTLHELGPFTTVDFQINKTTRVGNQSLQAFTIHCTN